MLKERFQHRVSLLLIRHLSQTLTDAERKELEAWIQLSPENRALFESLAGNQLVQEAGSIPARRHRILENIYAHIPEARKYRPFYYKTYFRWLSAAIIILMLSAGAFFLFRQGQMPLPELTNAPKAVPDIMSPRLARAVITLDNGEQITLDSAAKGQLAVQGNVNLVKLGDGHIAYRPEAGKQNSRSGYNTLAVPRGSKVVTLTLSDGTQVWLNAESSLRYPTVFTGKERSVEITGEAYFEVAKNPAMPFKVKRNDWEVQVLGTHFNVNAYQDEPVTRITLLEGSVQILKDHNAAILKPGQQVQLGASSVKIVNDVDLDITMAWKNGQFVLDGTDIKTLMRQVSRWYDIDVSYEGKMAEKTFGGSINRNVSLSRVIQALEENGVQCKVEDHRITIRY